MSGGQMPLWWHTCYFGDFAFEAYTSYIIYLNSLFTFGEPDFNCLQVVFLFTKGGLYL